MKYKDTVALVVIIVSSVGGAYGSAAGPAVTMKP